MAKTSPAMAGPARPPTMALVCIMYVCLYVCIMYVCLCVLSCMCGTFSKEALVHLTSMATSQISLIRDSLKRPFLVKNYL